MQAVKEKLEDMKEMRKVKAEAKAEEKAEKELAKTRVEVAHEVRLAKEAEASMEMHVAKAGRKVEKQMEKHGAADPLLSNDDNLNTMPKPTNTPPTSNPAGGALPRNHYL